MSDIGFRVQGNKGYLLRGSAQKELPRDTILEIYQLVLNRLSPNRDYTSVTSVSKLLRIIDLECEPDDSSDETEAVEEKPRGKSAPAVQVPAPAPKATVAPKASTGGSARKPPAKPAKEESEEEESEDEDSE